MRKFPCAYAGGRLGHVVGTGDPSPLNEKEREPVWQAFKRLIHPRAPHTWLVVDLTEVAAEHAIFDEKRRTFSRIDSEFAFIGLAPNSTVIGNEGPVTNPVPMCAR